MDLDPPPGTSATAAQPCSTTVTEGFLQAVPILHCPEGLVCQTHVVRRGGGPSRRENSYRIKARRYKRGCVLGERLFYFLRG